MEQKNISIKENTSKTTGKTFKNLRLRTGLNSMKKVEQGIDDGNYIIVKKKYAKDLYSEAYKSYTVSVEYDGQIVSFNLKDKEHSAWETTGVPGDSIKITMTAKPYPAFTRKDATGKDVAVPAGVSLIPSFEKVN